MEIWEKRNRKVMKEKNMVWIRGDVGRKRGVEDRRIKVCK